jgi:hypothetical protein
MPRKEVVLQARLPRFEATPTSWTSKGNDSWRIRWIFENIDVGTMAKVICKSILLTIFATTGSSGKWHTIYSHNDITNSQNVLARKIENL